MPPKFLLYTVVVKCPWEVCTLPRAFDNNSLCKTWGANRVNYGQLENRECSRDNRPFPNSLVPLFQSESKCETILMKMTFICMKKKLRAELIFIWKVSHLDSLWNRGTTELGNGLFVSSNWIYSLVKNKSVKLPFVTKN